MHFIALGNKVTRNAFSMKCLPVKEVIKGPNQKRIVLR